MALDQLILKFNMAKQESRNNSKEQRDDREQLEKLVELKRTSKKTKGGNRFNFTALMVVGDQNGNVGIGIGKAKDVVAAIKKGVRQARKQMFEVPRVGEANTIPHDIRVKHKGAEILLKPAPAGTGVKAGGAVRVVAEAAGLNNIVGKIIGSDKKKSNIQATVIELKKIKRSGQRKVELRNKKSKTSKSAKQKTESKATKGTKKTSKSKKK